MDVNMLAQNKDSEVAGFIREELRRAGRSIGWLAIATGIEKSLIVKGLTGTRQFKYGEVSAICRALGKRISFHDGEEPQASYGLIPLYGRTSHQVWSRKGPGLPIGYAPIKAVSSTETGEQRAYLIENGSRKGQYAVCVPIEEGVSLSVNDLVIVEDEWTLKEEGVSVVRITIRVMERDGSGISLADAFGGEGGVAKLSYPSKGVRILAKVIGVYEYLR